MGYIQEGDPASNEVTKCRPIEQRWLIGTTAKYQPILQKVRTYSFITLIATSLSPFFTFSRNEATFQDGRFIAKSDILIRDKLGWQLFEVKSGLNHKQDYLLDLAYTAFVMTRAGKPPILH